MYEIGLGDLICGVTHECTFPLQALDKPKVILPAIDFSALNAAQIDSKVKELSYHNLPLFRVNENLLQDIRPDLIISQNLCSVCAPYTRETKTTAEILGYEPENLILNPKNFFEAIECIETIGIEVGNLLNAHKLINNIEYRVKQIESVIKTTTMFSESISVKETVLFLDWINPFFVAGHWIPEMIEIAGGESLNRKAESDSKRITIEDLGYLNPDKIVICPCGFSLERTRYEYERLCETKWNSLTAVKNKEIYLVDSSYFSKPSPRLITGIEILCKIINPNSFRDIQVPPGSLLHV